MTPISLGENAVTLLIDGAQAYPAMLSAIESAEFTVCLQSYIFRDDETGHRFGKVLMQKAQQGVEINFMYDAWGSSVSDEYLSLLRKSGVRVLPFGKVRWTYPLDKTLSRLRRRNHRKELTVDGRVAFVGGLNISNEYAPIESGGAGWRDTHLRVEGPAAQSLQAQFLMYWNRLSGPTPNAALYRPARVNSEPRIQFLANEFDSKQKHIRAAYMNAIHGATRSIYLTHAYFVPPLRMLRSLAKVARRGVDVRCIVAASTDVKWVHLASQALYGRLLEAGARIYEWQGRVLHAKTAVFDGQLSTVGSSNLDALSLHANLEVNAFVDDEALGAQMNSQFLEDLKSCEEVTLARWKNRAISDVALSWMSYQTRYWL